MGRPTLRSRRSALALAVAKGLSYLALILFGMIVGRNPGWYGGAWVVGIVLWCGGLDYFEIRRDDRRDFERDLRIDTLRRGLFGHTLRCRCARCLAAASEGVRRG